MRHARSNTLNHPLAAAALLVALGACDKKGAASEPAPATSAPAATPPAAPAPATAGPAPAIAGRYTLKGTNPGGGEYGGSLLVTARGAVHQFSWKSGESAYDGVAVQAGNTLGVAFASGTEGKGCSVVHYKVGADGTLSGRWGEWGTDESGTETATRTAGTGLDGKYDVTGTRIDGKPYKGTLSVAAQGAGYLFNWSTGDTSEGFGIRMGEYVSVGIGGGQCGFVAYQIKPDGTLDGQWSSFKSKAVGTEVATRAP